MTESRALGAETSLNAAIAHARVQLAKVPPWGYVETLGNALPFTVTLASRAHPQLRL